MNKPLIIITIITSLGVAILPGSLAADPKQDRGKEDKREIHKSLEEAQSHFLEALRILGEAGKKTYEKHLPELKERSGEALQKSQKLLEKWQDQIEEELDNQLKSLEKQQKKDRQPKQSEKTESLPLI
jgi:hypothetical protein